MARLDLPPPPQTPLPLWHTLTAGDSLIRLFNPTVYNAGATMFRFFGPVSRFDHQRTDRDGAASIDAERGIYYAAPNGGLSCCVVEVFGDLRRILFGEWRVAYPILKRDLRLLDLRGSGAMRAGTIAAVAKCPHEESQPWSRYFYEAPEYESCDGIIYYNAHNDQEAIALYERAADALDCPDERILRLEAPALRSSLEDIALQNGMIFASSVLP